MLSLIKSLGLAGIRGYLVAVECDLANGLPNFEVVGLPDAVVREARVRVRSACKNCGFDFPLRRITVNLAPADKKKEGAVYDLPILLGLLAASGQLMPITDDCAFIGELSLDGAVRRANGVLSMALAAKNAGITSLIVPDENAREASLVPGLTVYGVKHVSDVVAHLRGELILSPCPPWRPDARTQYSVDFSDVKGQENVKRALEIAAVGGHNILLIGPPGAGKSMLARRIPTILPDMTYDESIETTEIHSVCGLTGRDEPFVTQRPFRSPHHTISSAGLAGGGSNPRPGEISLSHNGVLFLDEFPEFSREAIEALRQPLEDGEILVSRVAGSYTFPASFMLVCAMNPCKCGWHGHSSGRCTCTGSMVSKYIGQISGPMMDRIDMHVEVPAVRYDDLTERAAGEASSVIRERVNVGRAVQTRRFEGTPVKCNARMTAAMLGKFCALDEAADALLHAAFDKFGMTGRSHAKVLRIARTIADMSGCENIGAPHIAEAIQFRTLDRGEV